MKNNKLLYLVKKISDFEKKSVLKRIIIRPPIPKQLEELQKYIINSQIEVDKLMAEMIRVKLWARVYDDRNPLPSIRLLGGIYQVVEYLPYREKIKILCSLEPSFNPVKNRIRKMYEIRNLFAHTDLKELIRDYNVENI